MVHVVSVIHQLQHQQKYQQYPKQQSIQIQFRQIAQPPPNNAPQLLKPAPDAKE